MASMPTPPRLVSRIPPPPPRESFAPRGEHDLLVAGDILEGRYQIEEQIGEGGVGVVYRALQLKLHRRVAIKVLQREQIGDQLLRPRFEREAVTLAALAHPNIVSLTDYGVIRGRPFIVMELLEGKTLRELIDREGALELSRALALVRQILYALGYAHGKGVVHRDLKPANIVVDALPDQPEHLKILDFGLAKLLPGSLLDSGEKLSRAGFAFGTPAYMSPEHATLGELDERSDVYSLGVVLFEILTGQKPFNGANEVVIRAHLMDPLPRLAEVRAELGKLPKLQAFLDRATAKNKAERFSSAHDMREALDQLLPSQSVPPPASSLRPELQRLRESLAPVQQKASVFLSERVQPALRKVGPFAVRVYEQAMAFAKALYARAEPACRAFYERAKPRVIEATHKTLDAAQGLAKRGREQAQKLAARRSLPAPSLAASSDEPLPPAESAAPPAPPAIIDRSSAPTVASAEAQTPTASPES